MRYDPLINIKSAFILNAGEKWDINVTRHIKATLSSDVTISSTFTFPGKHTTKDVQVYWKTPVRSSFDIKDLLPSFDITTGKFNIYTVCALMSKTLMSFIKELTAHNSPDFFLREYEPEDFNNNLFGHFCTSCCISDHYFGHWNCLLHKAQKVRWQWAHL